MQDVYRVVVTFLHTWDIPVINRESIKSYVLQKWIRLNGLPLLVDITWHGPSFCHKYCVCRIVNDKGRIDYYMARLVKRIKYYL